MAFRISKAFAIWLALPYVFLVVVAVTARLLYDYPIDLRAFLLDWRVHAFVLAPCAILAGCGTIILWALAIQRVLLGIIVGSILALSGVALCALVAVAFFGGFEETPGILLVAFTLSLPSCLAGAYAGYLRSKEPLKEPRTHRATGWWPAARS